MSGDIAEPRYYYRLVLGTTITNPEELKDHLTRSLADTAERSGSVDEPWNAEVFCRDCGTELGVLYPTHPDVAALPQTCSCGQ